MLVRFVALTESKKYHTMDQCATSFGPTLTVRLSELSRLPQFTTHLCGKPRYPGLGLITSWSRLPFWCRHNERVHPYKCHRSNSKGPSARHGRLQTHVRSDDRHRLECAKLLLSVCCFKICNQYRASCSQYYPNILSYPILTHATCLA